GESLIPFPYQPLERLGMIPKMRASHFQKKYSVCFIQADGRASDPFYFFNRYDRETIAQTWQVVRSEFDVMLRDNAIEKGAEVREETTVEDLLMEGDRVVGVRAAGPDGKPYELRAPITLDCSGKEAFSSNRRSWRLKDPYLKKVAVWTYYEGAKRGEGIDEGATIVAYVPEEKGWFWYIPQHDDRVSVGVVAEGKYLTRDGVRDPKEIFEREIHQNR
ncbi:MAG TPA: tryptophan 7-halogenase, partial [Bacteroidia bacterium]|nr:tryptophan 7-halogenase [Bacteroidia bacterium]